MTTIDKVGLSAVVILVTFAAGRASAPDHVVKDSTTTQTKSKEDKTRESRKRHKETTVTEISKPDGTKEKITKIVDDKSSGTTKTEREGSQTSTTKHEEVTKSSPTSLSALAGVQITDLSAGFVYGAHVSRPVLGPISIGAFGITSGVVGLSVGLSL